MELEHPDGIPGAVSPVHPMEMRLRPPRRSRESSLPVRDVAILDRGSDPPLLRMRRFPPFAIDIRPTRIAPQAAGETPHAPAPASVSARFVCRQFQGIPAG